MGIQEHVDFDLKFRRVSLNPGWISIEFRFIAIDRINQECSDWVKELYWCMWDCAVSL